MPLTPTETERAERLLKRTIAKRDALASQVQFLQDLALKLKDDKTSLPLFRARKRDIDSSRSQFLIEQDAIYDILIQLQREDEYEATHVPVGKTFSEHYYQIFAIADDSTVDPVALPSNTGRNVHEMSDFIQLPTIELPNFDGNLVEWCSFRDTFLSLVHNNTKIGNLRRFHYLLMCVTGSARTVVKSIPLSAANYDIAWAAMIERYDNQRLLATAHLDRLFAFRPITTESLSSLLTFSNVFQENIAAIEALGVTDLAGFMLFFIGARVLDPTTRHLFENSVAQNIIPTFDVLIKFVQQRCKILENTQGLSKTDTRAHKNKPMSCARSLLSTGTTSGPPSVKTCPNSSTVSADGVKQCSCCQGDHAIYRCSMFKKWTTVKRRDHVTKNKLCMSCLSASHTVTACTSKYTCKVCGQRHNTLLHQKKEEIATPPCTSHQVTAADSSDVSEKHTHFAGAARAKSTVLLGTAIVRVRNKVGHFENVRILIDSGSQISAITTECAARLGLTRRKCRTEIVGLGQSPVKQVKGSVTCSFVPYHAPYPIFNCPDLIVLNQITSDLPSAPLPSSVRTCYEHLALADPQFDRPATVDMLIGGDLFPHLIHSEAEIKHTQGLPSAMDTHLGWILIGTVSAQDRQSSPLTSLTASSNPSIDVLMRRFWSIEEPVTPTFPTTEDEQCERWFVQTTSRKSDGRFCVALPFRDSVRADNTAPSHGLGNSRSLALKRLYNLEQRLGKDIKLYDAYRSFMEDYVSLGHMKLASRPGKYFIPHHAVLKRDGDVSKLRVVFDASAKSSSGLSLNDALCVGPKLQNDIGELLLQCRLYKFIFIADIVKMYRQIEVRDEDCVYQHILWRSSPEHEVQEYELLTVTYGLSSAPFLAIRVLHALDKCCEPQFPAAKGVLIHNTYVDDILVGRNTEDELLHVQKHVIGLLKSAGCQLKKWCSNSDSVLKCVSTEDVVSRPSFDPVDEPFIKVLGLHWDPHCDVFGYHTHVYGAPETKRGVLSTIARLFDPVGALGPILLWAKSFMQQLWQESMDWDTPLPSTLRITWLQFLTELPSLSKIAFVRHIDTRDYRDIQLIGFADASQLGYAAMVYIRVVSSSEKVQVHLLTGKTKVAPLKNSDTDMTLTIPRLELCAALLLAQLLHRLHLKLSPTVNISRVRAWTDSSVVLSWLTADQKSFKIFVTNRVAKIHLLVPNCVWSHVSTTENPADPSSRGLLPEALISCPLHWTGPSFLCLPEHQWPKSNLAEIPVHNLPDVKSACVTVNVVQETPMTDGFLRRFSTFNRLQRVLVYVLRFVYNAIMKRPTVTGAITFAERQHAVFVAIRLTQRAHFPDLFKQLSNSERAVKPQTLAQLAPFIDSSGLIRVGGRLQSSFLTNEAKHPSLLPKSSCLTSLIINHYHLTFLHAGPKLVISMLRQKFWIISGRDAVRRTIFTCVPCTRHKAQHPIPSMGILPESRVQPHRVFSRVGLDFGGPFLVKECKRRNTRTTKVYISVFICMAVKAIHVEVVSDLTTEAFLAAMDRFVARRGVPTDLYSDCGTNYVGAARQLKTLLADAEVQNQLSSRIECTWHFNPPAAPHFGGLWEAAIKSIKFHLKRVIGTQILTYEEFQTVVTRVEGILNSRPLTSVSTDPHDFEALTPGHFLIGQPISTIPEKEVTSVPINRLTRWQLLRQLHQSFWKRWQREYLTTLQARQKWTKVSDNLAVGDVVIIDAPNQPPTVWRMGRVISVHPGPDDIVRVVTVKTQEGEMRRPVVKLVKLPVDTTTS